MANIRYVTFGPMPACWHEPFTREQAHGGPNMERADLSFVRFLGCRRLGIANRVFGVN